MRMIEDQVHAKFGQTEVQNLPENFVGFTLFRVNFVMNLREPLQTQTTDDRPNNDRKLLLLIVRLKSVSKVSSD